MMVRVQAWDFEDKRGEPIVIINETMSMEEFSRRVAGKYAYVSAAITQAISPSAIDAALARIDLPRPDVNVTSRETDSGNEVDVVISRDGKERKYTGGGYGKTRDVATSEAISEILGDGHTAEWLPH